MTIKALVVAALVLLASPAFAADETVEQLNLKCRQAGPTGMFCLGFTAGVANAMFLSSGDIKACPGDHLISHGAIQRAFIEWADLHPEHWGMSSLVGVVLAVQATWPCPE